MGSPSPKLAKWQWLNLGVLCGLARSSGCGASLLCVRSIRARDICWRIFGGLGPIFASSRPADHFLRPDLPRTLQSHLHALSLITSISHVSFSFAFTNF